MTSAVSTGMSCSRKPGGRLLIESINTCWPTINLESVGMPAGAGMEIRSGARGDAKLPGNAVVGSKVTFTAATSTRLPVGAVINERATGTISRIAS
jgi:hypothetical protein